MELFSSDVILFLRTANSELISALEYVYKLNAISETLVRQDENNPISYNSIIVTIIWV